MSPKRNILVNSISWTEEIEEIRSIRAQIEKNLPLNIISLSLANFLGCRIQKEKNELALVGNGPLTFCGKTYVLIRLPQTQKRKSNFERILCVVAINPKSHVILSRSSYTKIGSKNNHN